MTTTASSSGQQPTVAAVSPLILRNGKAQPLAYVPLVRLSRFQHWLNGEITKKNRVVAFFALPEFSDPEDAAAEGHPAPEAGGQAAALGAFPPEAEASNRLLAIVANDEAGTLMALSTEVGASYPSLTPRLLPQLHLFERELYEENGIMPEGHPWLKPVRFSRNDGPKVGVMEYFRIDGEEVHEVAVGPIHAGVIECGHFRFQCLGEVVMHLEISLGYQHRGARSLILRGPEARTLPLMEAIAGDTTIGHTWAYCAVMEALTAARPTPRAQLIRSLALELERLANHTGDMGALAGDVGFLPTSSFCGRLRGDWLNMTALLCGSRFGRGLMRVGGTAFDVDEPILAELEKRIKAAARDTEGAIALMWGASSVMARVVGIGKIHHEDVESLGMCGLAAKSAGVMCDCRFSHPLEHAIAPEPLETLAWGDVYARAMMRHREITASVRTCLRAVAALRADTSAAASRDTAGTALVPAGPRPRDAEPAQGRDHAAAPGAGAPATREMGTPAPLHLAVGLVEGWRGEVCHVGITDAAGAFAAYQIVDPSFHNWIGLALALREQQISDFPLCNKSFNLSYCGHDL